MYLYCMLISFFTVLLTHILIPQNSRPTKTKRHVGAIERFLHVVKYWIGFSWLRIKSNNGILWM